MLNYRGGDRPQPVETANGIHRNVSNLTGDPPALSVGDDSFTAYSNPMSDSERYVAHVVHSRSLDLLRTARMEMI